ncbi:MAG: F0F1 ATP synthase subunit alpha [Deltaproteobacteria bacterium]|nr:F0F1 ATP synthase subunit alpha [Deltaproteobacteria bacterium]
MPETDIFPKISPPLAGQAGLFDDYRVGLRVAEQGRLISVGDGVAWIEGLPSAAMEEILLLEDGSKALVYHLGEKHVGAILLHQTPHLTAGTVVHLTGNRLSIPVGDALLGRVIDPMGNPLDGEPPPDCKTKWVLDAPAPPIITRDYVHTPMYTGNKMVDTMVPIGKGQRQLILGDNGVGKSTLSLDIILNQAGKDVLCVLVMIGQKRSSVVDTLHTLRETGAIAHTVMVVAEATALPGLKYLAPYSGCEIAESWMYRGRDTLVIYDDLTTHAQAYRELSLLLRRPPGREAYPGDVFYLHARLLERSTCLSPTAGGGTMTALPLVETKQGEISAFIPTNLISITDGQVYLDQKLFASGFLPAVDIRKSVSRIGGKAQDPRIMEEAGRMKLDYLQFLELEVFTRFGSRLEASMARKIQRGRVLREMLKQDQLDPKPITFQMAWMVAYNEGLLDDLTAKEIPRWISGLESGLTQTPVSLVAPREQWVKAVHEWLKPLMEPETP